MLPHKMAQHKLLKKFTICVKLCKTNNVVPSVYPSSDPRYVPTYAPNVNLYRSPSEKHVDDLQEERRTTIQQVKAVENIIALVEIKVKESAQL